MNPPLHHRDQSHDRQSRADSIMDLLIRRAMLSHFAIQTRQFHHQLL
jgi:hypothetical protein